MLGEGSVLMAYNIQYFQKLFVLLFFRILRPPPPREVSHMPISSESTGYAARKTADLIQVVDVNNLVQVCHQLASSLLTISIRLVMIKWCEGLWHRVNVGMFGIHSPKHHRLVANCQFYRLVATCQQLVDKLQQACQFHQVANSLLRSGLLQLVICRLVTTCWSKFNKLVKIINLEQTCWQLATGLSSTSCGKPGERILISACCNKMLQGVNRLAGCNFGVFGGVPIHRNSSLFLGFTWVFCS